MERVLPSYPLFVKDPNFSLWSASDELNKRDTESWYGERKRLYGFLKANGRTWCFLGDAERFAPFGVEAAKQTELKVSAFATEYVFLVEGGRLSVRFVSPLPLDDPALVSMPVCYMEYAYEGGGEAEISLFAFEELCYNSHMENRIPRNLKGAVLPLEGFEAACLGLGRQFPLSNCEDECGADWGWWYLAGQRAFVGDTKDLFAYLCTGTCAFTSDTEGKCLCAVCRSLEGAILIAYDDVVSIDYFGDHLKGLYLSEHTITEALTRVWRGYTEIDVKLQAFSQGLSERAEKYGPEYQHILNASLRQSIAAHKLVRNREGELLFLSKECNSNGCIATVDVSYPSMPLFLLYNPEFVKGMMRPILKFAAMPVWEYDFAPHDVGAYPVCSGQVYGLSKTRTNYHGNDWAHQKFDTHFPIYLLPAGFEAFDLEEQMPVEECADMLIMFLACYRFDGDLSFFRKWDGLAEKWVNYLITYGLKPENQLCTDDFAGHMKNNLNLAVKAVVAIACYAELAGLCGNIKGKEASRSVAEDYAGQITAFSQGFSHMPFSWDTGEETFSLKYNFAFDKLLGLGLFPKELLEREVAYYTERCNAFGTPLDSRSSYTKSDWLLWAASLTEDRGRADVLIHAVSQFLKKSPKRVPFADWYETEDGEYHWFRNRTVQGGCFILLLGQERKKSDD